MKKNPATYRLRADQDAWLEAQAKQKGHGIKAQELRLVIDQAMRRSGKKKAAA